MPTSAATRPRCPTRAPSGQADQRRENRDLANGNVKGAEYWNRQRAREQHQINAERHDLHQDRQQLHSTIKDRNHDVRDRNHDAHARRNEVRERNQAASKI